MAPLSGEGMLPGAMVHGQYRRGEMVGHWREVDPLSEKPYAEALVIRKRDKGGRSESVTLLGQSLRVTHGREWSFGFEGLDFEIPGSEGMLVARRGAPGVMISGGDVFGNRFNLDEIPNAVLVGNDGTLTLGTEKVATQFDQDRRVMRQVIKTIDQEPEIREAPPWLDPIRGEPAKPTSESPSSPKSDGR